MSATQEIKSENFLFSGAALKRLLIPLMIEQAFGLFVGMADSIMVSHTGEAALSGVSLVDMLVVMIFNLFAALTTGGSVIASQYLGAKKKDRACDAAVQLCLVTLVISTTTMGASLLFKRHLLHLFFGSIEQDVMVHALTYFTISALSFPFLALWSAANALFRANGNSRITMKTSLLVNGLNVIGNAILIYGFNMGVAGAALSTLLARIIACVLSLHLLKNPSADIHIDFRVSWKPEWQMIKNILRIGIPSGFENTFFQLGRVLVLGIISTFGTAQIAANSVANTFSTFPTIPAQAVSLAMITVVGQCVGAGDLQQTKYYIKRLMKKAYLFFLIAAIAVSLVIPLGLKAYNLSPDASRLALILYGIHTFCGVFLWPASFTMPNALRATNNVTFTMIVSIVSMVFVRILGSYVLGLYMGYGAIGVWCSMVLDWMVRVTCFAWCMLSGRWKKKALTVLQ